MILRGRPSLADKESSAPILNDIATLSEEFGTKISI